VRVVRNKEVPFVQRPDWKEQGATERQQKGSIKISRKVRLAVM
jgi:hypothetical protein